MALRLRACGATLSANGEGTPFVLSVGATLRSRSTNALFVLAALLACTGRAPAPAPEKAAPETAADASSAKTPWVKAGNPEEIALLEAPALVLSTPESNAGVSPPFRARIVKVHVKPGMRVKRGDPVADVVMPEVVQAAGTYSAAATRVEAYGKRAQQLEGLKKEGMVKLTELLDVQTKLAEARSDQQSALAMLRVASLGAHDAQHVLSGTGEVVLRSPIDGVVTQVKVAIGENREAAGEPIVRIAGDSEPRIEVRAARLIPTRAHFELWLATGEKLPVRLVGYSPQVDVRDGTRLVWFGPYPGAKLTQGQTGKVRMRLEEEEKAVAVPARAVSLGEKGPYVIVLKDGKPQKVKVEVLAASGSDALVKGAIVIGEEVAADASALEAGSQRSPPPEFEERLEAKGQLFHEEPKR